MVIYILIAVSLITGCAYKTEKNISDYQEATLKSEKSIKITPVHNKKKHLPPVIKRKGKLKKVDIFEGKFFTFSANNAPLMTVLYAISKDTGLNIIVSPDVNKDITITANFINTPLKEALDIIMNLTGLYYEIRGNVLYIKQIITKAFKIPFVYASSQYQAFLGGDVLGASLGGGIGGAGGAGTGGGGAGGGFGGAGGGFGGGFSGGGVAAGLSGNYTVQYQTPQESVDFFTQLEDNISSFLSENGKYTLNKLTGILIVTDKKRNVELIENYIKKLKREIQKQVLIEAKIVEVELSDEYQFGVDWSVLIKDILNTGANLTISQVLSLENGAGAFSIEGGNFSTLINALKKVGKVKTLANPRLRVLNGQSALISTGKVIPFWEKQVQTLAAQFATQQVTFTRTSILDGILLGVTVHINDDGSVIMNVVPVSSKFEGVKQFIQNNEVVAEAPILNVKETGTVIKAKDGDMVIIGGLISEDKQKTDEAIPGLSSSKLIGGIFKRKIRKNTKRELIIFLKPRIVSF